MGWVVRERPDGRKPGARAGREVAGSPSGTPDAAREREARWRERAARVGERMAEELLRLRGFEILDRNVRSGRGEIDLIARECETIVFVEVKLRSGRDSASPLLAVNWKKREDVERAATRWLQSKGLTERPVRFDVVGVTLGTDGSQLRLEHVRNAFAGGGRHFY